MTAPAGYSNVIFDDAFSGSSLDTSKWNAYITSKAANGWPWNSNSNGGSGTAAGGFDAEYFSPTQVSVNNGLTLTATSGSTQPGYQWTSGVVSTYGKFQFDGGFIQIKAKMPAGAGMWPGLWLLPGPGGTAGDDFELDVFEGNNLGNNVSPLDNAAWHLHTPSGTMGGTANSGSDLSAGYHVYGVRWIPGQSVTWYVDGVQVGQLTSAQIPIPNEPMELIMDLQVANAAASGWMTTVNGSTPSPSSMQIAEVRIYQ